MADGTGDESLTQPTDIVDSSLPSQNSLDSTRVSGPVVREASSDGEGERATRERLKKTSIAGMAQQSKAETDTTSGHLANDHTLSEQPESDTNNGGNGSRGRPAKKRSFEDLTRGDAGGDGQIQDLTDPEAPNPKSGHHKRMRSRDVASGEHAVDRVAAVASATSPVQEESGIEVGKISENTEGLVDQSPPKQDTKAQPTTREREEDIQTNTETSSRETRPAQTAANSGFANTSTASPFATTANPTSTVPNDAAPEAKTTSATAFASSGLAAFASSEKSPFGNVTKPTGGFGSSSSTSFGSGKTGFGGGSSFASKQSNGGFGASTGFGTPSGFGSASGFGATKPFGTGSSSFAGTTGKASAFGTGKAFGSAKEKDDDDEGSEDDEDEESGHKEDDEEQDDRFVAQDVETGEEEERTIFAARAKLYHFEKEWKERGVGTIKINMKEESVVVSSTEIKEQDVEAGTDQGQSPTIRRGRLIMRTDGVHRVILNTPIFKNMTIGTTEGNEPVGKTMHLTGLEEGKPRAFQIKIGKEEVIKELYWKVIDLRTEAKV